MSPKFYAARHASKFIRKFFGTKEPAYLVCRKMQRQAYCEYYSIGYAEFGLAKDRIFK